MISSAGAAALGEDDDCQFLHTSITINSDDEEDEIIHISSGEDEEVHTVAVKKEGGKGKGAVVKKQVNTQVKTEVKKEVKNEVKEEGGNQGRLSSALVQAWEDQSSLRPAPQGYPLLYRHDTERERRGLMVGFMDLVDGNNNLIKAEVAAYVRYNLLEFRLVPGLQSRHPWSRRGPGLDWMPRGTIVVEQDSLKPVEFSWSGYWLAVKGSEISLDQMKGVIRSYIQVKEAGRWADKATVQNL